MHEAAITAVKGQPMATVLTKYHRKRDFDKTDEPRGTVAKKRGRTPKTLSFVVQHHIARRDHFDFRLEWDGLLKSWAVPKGPSYNRHDKRLAVMVEDHPLDYQSFEGTIPKGEYGGGSVMIWDVGTWTPLVDVEDGLKDGNLKFSLDGKRLKGKWALIHIKPRDGEKDNNWLLIKERDDYENSRDIAEYDTSVATGRTMEEIAEDKPVLQPHAKSKKPAKSSKPKKTAKASVALADVPLSHPEKVLDKASGTTKGDLAEYYTKVAERMLPYLANRVISAVRCPGGIERHCFYKKHPANDTRGVVVLPIENSDGDTEDYYYIEGVAGILSEVQMNTIEFHTWGSSADTLEKPDMMVFDLDPDEGMDVEQIREGVLDLRSILDELSITTFLKTSGGKGYHVVIPFRPAASWDRFHAFAQNIAKTMEAKWPTRYTSNVRKNQRKNRIFIDWMRNGRGATSVAPYSVRARENMPVSMPITWKELHTVAPAEIRMNDAIARLRRRDPWNGFFDVKQRLK